MQIHSINARYNKNLAFGINYKLSEKTIKQIEKSTGFSYKEMTTLTIEESRNLMKKRGTLKELSKVKQWCASKYRQFGQRLGLLQKEHNFYTDIH